MSKPRPISPTPKQQELLAFIKAYNANFGRAPSVRFMALAMGWAPSFVMATIKRLKNRGHLLHYKGRVWPIYYGKENG